MIHPLNPIAALGGGAVAAADAGAIPRPRAPDRAGGVAQ